MQLSSTSGGQRQSLHAMRSMNFAFRTLAKLPLPLGRSSRAAIASPQLHLHFNKTAYSISTFRTFATAVDEEFYAPAGTSFASLGLDDRVCASLAAAGFEKSAHAQFLAAPAILQGSDVVLAAETGSGKTLAYLAPLASLALSERIILPEAPTTDTPPPAEDWLEPLPFDSDPTATEPAHRPRPTATLVLCPNALLCQQVVSVASQAFKDPSNGDPLVNVALVSSQSPPPFNLPDIVVTTPGSLSSLLDGAGPAFGADWTRAGISAWARHVVLDEADLLLGGGYAKHLDAILDVLKIGDRENAARRACAELGISLDDYWEMPRLIRKAVQNGGAEAALKAGYKVPPDAQPPATGAVLPWLRQYIFVAATMPREGGKNVGADIADSHPKAVWLSGRQLHQARRSLTHRWRQYDSPASRAEALVETLLSDDQFAQGQGRVMVFAKDVASANTTAKILKENLKNAGAPSAELLSPSLGPAEKVLLYHSGVPAAERASALQRMSKEEGLILVCTDAAARGLDIEDISHVIQADFAGSAIDFLHRVGRTARAGKTGTVTSLYAADVAPLVDAIRDAVAEGRPVEGAFSRKRSFKKKFKRYGKYVPRGERSERSEASAATGRGR